MDTGTDKQSVSRPDGMTPELFERVIFLSGLIVWAAHHIFKG